MASPAIETVLETLYGQDLGGNRYVGPATLAYLNKHMPTLRDTPGDPRRQLFLGAEFSKNIGAEKMLRMLPYPLVDPNAPHLAPQQAAWVWAASKKRNMTMTEADDDTG